MTNAEKYKTAKERAEAFEVWMGGCGTARCRSCELNTKNCTPLLHRAFLWLDIEAEEERPLPCPFCGSECYADGGGEYYGGHWIQCSNGKCDYSSACKSTEEDAISAHNSVAELVIESKEKEKAE